MIKLCQNNMDTLLQNIKISILEDTFWEDKLIPFLYPGTPKKFSCEVIILRYLTWFNDKYEEMRLALTVKGDSDMSLE